MNKLLATTLVSIGIAAAVPAALAQTAAPAADGGRGQFAQRQSEQRAFRMPSERLEAQLAYIKTALKITPAQQSQWDAYVNVRRNQATAMDRFIQERRAQMAQRPADAQHPTFVERRERQRERLVVATQRLDELVTVEKPLYAALTPEQQRVANEVLAAGGRRHGGGFHHRGGRFGRA
jgi:periplasmic protein CpxP/Spy